MKTPSNQTQVLVQCHQICQSRDIFVVVVDWGTEPENNIFIFCLVWKFCFKWWIYFVAQLWFILSHTHSDKTNKIFFPHSKIKFIQNKSDISLLESFITSTDLFLIQSHVFNLQSRFYFSLVDFPFCFKLKKKKGLE